MADDKSSGYPGGDDRTIIVPSPGGRGPKPLEIAPAPPTPPVSPIPPLNQPAFIGNPEQAFASVGVNPLVAAANPLLILASQLGNTITHDDVGGLQQRVLSEIRSFESQAQANSIDPQITSTARYILCALLDEMVLNTVWGSASAWSSRSLLSTLHNETWGGERFFAVLNQLLRDPNANMDLLELMYICISLGFKGQYRVVQRGDEQLGEVQRQVFERLRRRRDPNQELSPRWMGTGGKRGGLRRYVPLWVVFSVSGALLLAVFLGFSVVLERSAAPTQQALEAMGRVDPTNAPAGN
ncbi:MAG: type IVB secretion system protein IcmH/DotU [Gammaproteobacteria bacterium]|nr:type IVB secretion system protein IcmH/DotU [Gammaproteobacteria bacterium]